MFGLGTFSIILKSYCYPFYRRIFGSMDSYFIITIFFRQFDDYISSFFMFFSPVKVTFRKMGLSKLIVDGLYMLITNMDA